MKTQIAAGWASQEFRARRRMEAKTYPGAEGGRRELAADSDAA